MLRLERTSSSSRHRLVNNLSRNPWTKSANRTSGAESGHKQDRLYVSVDIQGEKEGGKVMSGGDKNLKKVDRVEHTCLFSGLM